jgi:ubiquinone/menaquinone biosynthesis C-methylase UbiE
MEHIENPKKAFSEIKRVLKKDGYVVILVPTNNILFNLIWWFVTNFWWAKIWTDCHLQSFDKKNNIAHFAEKSGFSVVENKKFLMGMLNVVKLRKKE